MQIAVLSGKGGTGKTTISIGLAAILKNSIKVDCDVDANNMHLFYKGRIFEKEKFFSGFKAYIDKKKCVKCGKCIDLCKFSAIKNYEVDQLKCEGCGVCKLVCKNNAIILNKNEIALITEENIKDNGILIKADMNIGADGSGRLISELLARSKKYSNIKVVDGSPGIGCPVIATLTDTDICILVTEPSISGLSDLERIYNLSLNFKLKLFVCINKYDINKSISKDIEKYCYKNGIEIIGKIPYDDIVIESIANTIPIVFYKKSIAGKEVINISNKIIDYMERENLNENSNSE